MSSGIKSRIGTVIREKRIMIGYSQEDIAKIAGKTPGFIGQIERGESLPGLETLEYITRQLAIDANTFFYDSTDSHTENKEFCIMLDQMTPAMRKISMEIIKQIYKHGR